MVAVVESCSMSVEHWLRFAWDDFVADGLNHRYHRETKTKQRRAWVTMMLQLPLSVVSSEHRENRPTEMFNRDERRRDKWQVRTKESGLCFPEPRFCWTNRRKYFNPGVSIHRKTDLDYLEDLENSRGRRSQIDVTRGWTTARRWIITISIHRDSVRRRNVRYSLGLNYADRKSLVQFVSCIEWPFSTRSAPLFIFNRVASCRRRQCSTRLRDLTCLLMMIISKINSQLVYHKLSVLYTWHPIDRQMVARWDR